VSPRPDRWIKLYDLGQALQKSDERLGKLSRPSLRRRVARMVREAESFHGEQFTKTWRNRLYVNVSALDRIKPLGDQRLGELERNLEDTNAKMRKLERQVNGHGSKIRTLEQRQELTKNYLTALAAVE
jgi:chromosome segregation ATPase